MNNYLKTDSNMPKRYNTGVYMVRAGIISAVLLIGLLVYRFIIYSPPKLTFNEVRNFTVTSNYHYAGSGGRGSHSTWRITVTDDETGEEIKREVTKAQYERYPEGLQVRLPVFTTEKGKAFVSLDNNYDEKNAAWEYYDIHPTAEMNVMKYAVWIMLFITALFILGGIEKIQMSGSRVFFPKEVDALPEKLSKEIKQPDYDEIFKDMKP